MLSFSRIGIAASKMVGGAVQRNRAKRRLRAWMREISGQITPGWDIVVYARRPILEAEFQNIGQALKKIIERAGLLVSDVNARDASSNL